MALGLTQPLTEMSTRNFAGGGGRPASKADNHTSICEPIAVFRNLFLLAAHHDSTRHTKMLFPSKIHDIRQLIPKQCYKRRKPLLIPAVLWKSTYTEHLRNRIDGRKIQINQ
jgi:hypothetical protein